MAQRNKMYQALDTHTELIGFDIFMGFVIRPKENIEYSKPWLLSTLIAHVKVVLFNCF